METLRQRRDFVSAAKASKAVSKSFILQRRFRHDDPDGPVRVGFTASKKVGNAVARNRAKRRLRALARDINASSGVPGNDYVLIARAGHTIERSFELMRADLSEALEKLDRNRAKTANT